MTPMMTPTVIRWAFLFPMSMGPLCVHAAGRGRTESGRAPGLDMTVARCPSRGAPGHGIVLPSRTMG